ncbi:hypothetical protein R50073_26860 [Maricurvus nonylphenolicus]|uniref:hypothetical protein n=1 Tax=Maricurvus nonylphenolicus TaxID=1008307 RepID=UPI0036F2CE98
MKPIFKSPAGENFFFGYYDKSPFDSLNAKILAHKANFIDRMPNENDQLEIGFFDWVGDGAFVSLTSTKAWNWQQGSMLQWVGPDYSSRIIYNDRVNNKFVSVLMDIESREKIELPIAIYSMHPNGNLALCIDNERHYWFRGGYNYQGIQNQDKNIPIDTRDGIWLMDIANQQVEQVVNIVDLINISPLKTMEGSVHYLEHIMFNPTGERFCFLHRWQQSDGSVYSRLYTANTNGDDLYLLSDSGRVSHFCWRNKDEILAWGALPNVTNSLRKYKAIAKYILRPLLPLYHKLVGEKSTLRRALTGDSYILFQDRSEATNRIFSDMLCEDGHPSYRPGCENLFVTDTYQDEDHIRHLKICNSDTKTVTNIASLNSCSQLDNTSLRCDLHPKWSYQGDHVCIDTVHEGSRQIYVYDVASIV